MAQVGLGLWEGLGLPLLLGLVLLMLLGLETGQCVQ